MAVADVNVEFVKSVRSENLQWGNEFGAVDYLSNRPFGGYGSRILYVDTEHRFPFRIGYEVGHGKSLTGCFIELLPLEEIDENFKLEVSVRVWFNSPTNGSATNDANARNVIFIRHTYGNGEPIRQTIPFQAAASLRGKDKVPVFFQILTVNAKIVMDRNDKKLQAIQLRNSKMMSTGFKAEKFMDFEIEVEGEVFKASKYILSSHSDVFDAMFSANMAENNTSRMVITDFTAQTVKDMLKYLHSCGFTFPDKGIEKLAQIADKYNIRTLMERCSYGYNTYIGPDNFVNLLIYAFTHGLEELKQKTLTYAGSEANRKIFFNSDAYFQLNASDPQTGIEICRALL